jgi:hypothetical protein
MGPIVVVVSKDEVHGTLVTLLNVAQGEGHRATLSNVAGQDKARAFGVRFAQQPAEVPRGAGASHMVQVDICCPEKLRHGRSFRL